MILIIAVSDILTRSKASEILREMSEEIVRGFFEAVVDLDELTLHLDSSCIGKAVSFRYKSSPFRICLPNFEIPTYSKVPYHKRPIEPTFENTKVRLAYIFTIGVHQMSRSQIERFGQPIKYRMPFTKWADEDEQEKRIGRRKYIQHTDMEVFEFGVKKMIVQSTKAVDAKTARKYKKQITEWQTIFPLWLQAVEFRDLSSPTTGVTWEHRPPGDTESHFIPTYKYYYDLGHNIRRIRSKVRQNSILTFNRQDPIATKSIVKALRLSQDGSMPPSYYIQLINALRHFGRGRYRQAVFDTATAFEIALTKILDDRLTNLDTQQKRLIDKRYKGKGIMALHDALKTLGVSGTLTESSIRENVTNPRNDAIHQGKDVSKVEAEKALEFVKTFIYARLPV